MHTVLVAEDEDITRRGIRSSVPWETFGCAVMEEAHNGEEGAALIKRLIPDIVIIDINMPVIDGLQILFQMKKASDYVAIILTGYSDPGYVKGAVRCGVVYYVLKPLNMGEMWEVLERAVLEMKNIAIIRRQIEGTHQLKNVSLLLVPDSREEADPVVGQVLDFITTNYERKLSLADLETELHYSERYINQHFQKAMGITMIDYLNRYRIQRALNLLRKHGTPISDVGWEYSIRDYKCFCYVFKKYMGCSPKGYQVSIKL